MFTGIVENIGEVVGLRPGNRSTRLELRAGNIISQVAYGASVAINGVCLTLTESHGDVGTFDVIPETWSRSNLKGLRVGSRVNIERALKLGDRIDGHFVQGHVDAVGTLDRVENSRDDWKLWIKLEADAMRTMVPKGSITLDGVSLTIVDVEKDRLSVALIPTTLKETTLGDRNPGDEINIEADILARIVLHRLDSMLDGVKPTDGITWDRLRNAGFTS